MNIKFFEASARDGTNVNELFFYLANEIYQDNKLKGNNNSNNGVILRLAPSNNVKRFGCF